MKKKGCGNHGCKVEKPTGQATNGRCKCKKNGGLLDMWWTESRIFTKHEGPRLVVIGLAVTHPIYKGRRIRTSPVVNLDEDKMTVETENSFYILGTRVDPEEYLKGDEI